MFINILIILVSLVGWVKNFIKFINCDFNLPYRAEVIYSLGLIPVVGVVTGWLNIKDE